MSGLYLQTFNSIKVQVSFDTVNTEGRNPCIPKHLCMVTRIEKTLEEKR